MVKTMKKILLMIPETPLYYNQLRPILKNEPIPIPPGIEASRLYPFFFAKTDSNILGRFALYFSLVFAIVHTEGGSEAV